MDPALSAALAAFLVALTNFITILVKSRSTSKKIAEVKQVVDGKQDKPT